MRLLRRQPGHALVAVLTMALGIGSYLVVAAGIAAATALPAFFPADARPPSTR